MALHIGLISGTSTDAVDAAIVDVRDDGTELVACHSEPIPEHADLCHMREER